MEAREGVIEEAGHEVGKVAVEGVDAADSVAECIDECPSVVLDSVGTVLLEASRVIAFSAYVSVGAKVTYFYGETSRICYGRPFHDDDVGPSHLSPSSNAIVQ